MTRPSQYLFFDTETTGLPQAYQAPAWQVENWPRMIQLAWVTTDASGQELDAQEFIVKPDGFRVPWRSAWVHHITTRRALRDGIPLDQVLDAFVAAVEQADVLIAHNMAFDEKIVGAELIRQGRPDCVALKPRRCTMKWSRHECGLIGPNGYKYPSLQELHKHLFRRRFRDAHHALTDVRACARCYFELQRREIMP